jgi:hypothetical protein
MATLIAIGVSATGERSVLGRLGQFPT